MYQNNINNIRYFILTRISLFLTLNYYFTFSPLQWCLETFERCCGKKFVATLLFVQVIQFMLQAQLFTNLFLLFFLPHHAIAYLIYILVPRTGMCVCIYICRALLRPLKFVYATKICVKQMHTLPQRHIALLWLATQLLRRSHGVLVLSLSLTPVHLNFMLFCSVFFFSFFL